MTDLTLREIESSGCYCVTFSVWVTLDSYQMCSLSIHVLCTFFSFCYFFLGYCLLYIPADLPKMVLLPAVRVSFHIFWTPPRLMGHATILTLSLGHSSFIFELLTFHSSDWDCVCSHVFNLCFIMSKCLFTCKSVNMALWALWTSLHFAHASSCSLVTSLVFFIFVSYLIISAVTVSSLTPLINCSLSCLLCCK